LLVNYRLLAAGIDGEPGAMDSRQIACLFCMYLLHVSAACLCGLSCRLGLIAAQIDRHPVGQVELITVSQGFYV
jgi:hypothetical protein